MKKILKWLGIVVLCAVVVFAAIIAYFKITRAHDFKLQEQRYNKLKDTIVKSEQDTVAFDKNSDIQLNEMQLIATHNSYPQ